MAYPTYSPFINTPLEFPRREGVRLPLGYRDRGAVTGEEVEVRGKNLGRVGYRPGYLVQRTLPVKGWSEPPPLSGKERFQLEAVHASLDFDVSLDVIRELTLDSLRLTRKERKFDPYQGNLLEIIGREENDKYLAYASGNRFAYLEFTKLSDVITNHPLDRDELPFNHMIPPTQTRAYFNTPIQQVIAPPWSEHPGVGVRTWGGVTLPGDLIPDLDSGMIQYPSIRKLPAMPADLTFHPHYQDSAALTRNDTIYLWQLGNELPERIPLPQDSPESNSDPLGQLRFGYHPRTFLYGTTETITMVDARSRILRTTSTHSPTLSIHYNGVDPRSEFILDAVTSHQFLSYDLRYLAKPIISHPYSNYTYRPHLTHQTINHTPYAVTWGPTTGVHLYSLPHEGFQLKYRDYPTKLCHPDDFLLPGQLSLLSPPCTPVNTTKARIVGLRILESQTQFSNRDNEMDPRSPIELIQMSEAGGVYTQTYYPSLVSSLDFPGFRPLQLHHQDQHRVFKEDSFTSSLTSTETVKELLTKAQSILVEENKEPSKEPSKNVSDDEIDVETIKVRCPPYFPSNHHYPDHSPWREIYETSFNSPSTPISSVLESDHIQLLLKDIHADQVSTLAKLPQIQLGPTACPILDLWDIPESDDVMEKDLAPSPHRVLSRTAPCVGITIRTNELSHFGIPQIGLASQPPVTFSQPPPIIHRAPAITTFSQPPSLSQSNPILTSFSRPTTRPQSQSQLISRPTARPQALSQPHFKTRKRDTGFF